MGSSITCVLASKSPFQRQRDTGGAIDISHHRATIPSMNILGYDHIVLTVADFDGSVQFYTRVLGMKHEGRSLFFRNSKINLHRFAGEFSPAARHPLAGSADICLIVEGDIVDAMHHIERAGGAIELGPVMRTGARGPMQSIYLRDPDGNLVEIASYLQTPSAGE